MLEVDPEKNSEEGGCFPTVYDFSEHCVSYPWRSNFHGSWETTKSCSEFDARIGGNFRCFEGKTAFDAWLTRARVNFGVNFWKSLRGVWVVWKSLYYCQVPCQTETQSKNLTKVLGHLLFRTRFNTERKHNKQDAYFDTICKVNVYCNLGIIRTLEFFALGMLKHFIFKRLVSWHGICKQDARF